MGLAALIDSDDPDGLPGVDLDGVLLTDVQLALLHKAARYRASERAGVARELRRVSATITGQIR